MADIIVDRKTYILISDTLQGTRVGLYPRDDLYPSNENNPIYPTNVISVENNIVEGSMKLDEVIAEGDIDLGKLYSTKFECDLFNVTNDIQGKFIKVYQTSEDGSSVLTFPVFLGYIDSCTSDRLGTDYHIIAYDLAYYYGGVNIASIWNRYMSTTTQITTTYGNFPKIQVGSGHAPSFIKIDWCAFLELVFDELGIVHDIDFNLELDVSGYSNVPQDYVSLYVNNKVQRMLLSDLITSICQLAEVMPHWGNDGVFRVIELDTSSTALQEDAIDLTDNYEKSSLNVSQLIVPPFNNISYKYNTYNNSANVVDTTISTSVNSNENKYEINNNILMLLTGCITGSVELRIPGAIKHDTFDNRYLIGNICSYLQSLDYYVGSVSLIISDVNDLIGQLVKININEDETIYFPILKSSYSGSLLINQTVSADGTIPTVKDTTPVDYSGESSNTQVNELTTTVTDLQSKVNAISTSVDYVTDGSIATNTNTSILSKNITAGTYMITGFISFPNTPNSDTGIRQMRIAYTTDLSTAISYDANDIKSAISGYRTLLKCTTIHTFSTDTTIVLVGNHTAGATLSDVIGQLNLLRIS